MKLIITETQLKEIVNIMSEAYVDDSYFVDNDIYDYEPTQSEIDAFNKVDKPVYHDFRGFEKPKDPNYIDPNKNFGEIPKQKRKRYDTRKFTGNAELVYLRPDGVEQFVDKGPSGVMNQLKKTLTQGRNSLEASRYRVKYEANF